MQAVIDVAIYRVPRASRRNRRKVLSVEARRAIDEAMALLSGGETGLQGDDALAERERLRVEAEAARQRQGELTLGAVH
ncbi:hypothetical protein ABE493_07775 [Stenotrophomonas terrae]|uniref:hypothetical protein n=1 Tax=Stenotrophomonas terrae TaxID=405446 RepID=UPI00320B6020